MIDFRTDEAGGVISVSSGGPIDTVAAEALLLLGLLYYRLSQQSQEAADLFAKLIQDQVNDAKDGIFSPSMLDLARSAESEVSHDDDV